MDALHFKETINHFHVKNSEQSYSFIREIKILTFNSNKKKLKLMFFTIVSQTYIYK